MRCRERSRHRSHRSAGVGKSTLTSVLIARARARNETVGVIAVDPSSRRSGGALLGDRVRIVTDPGDRGVYVRSMAARDRLGGLSNETVSAMVLMRAVYRRVIIESVGIGQSETDISFCADTVLLCVQPGSGDSLQFMKAGVMELPDIVAVTKADMSDAARRARADVEAALALAGGRPDWQVPVVCVAAARGDGILELETAIENHRRFLDQFGRLEAQRRAQEYRWIDEAVRSQFGTAGIAAAQRYGVSEGDGPFTKRNFILRKLASSLNL